MKPRMLKIRGPNVTPEIMDLITDIYCDNRQIGPTEARQKLLERMKEKGLDTIYGSDFPKLSTVSTKLKEIRDIDAKRPADLKELDEPWTIFSLNKHPIPPEALPKVLEVYRRFKLIAEQLRDEEAAFMPYFFTIRYVKWLARLSAFKSPEDTIIFSRILASAEQLSELTGHPPDYGLFEEALAALEANDFEREEAVMERYADWSTFELARLLGPQGQKFVERFREIEEKKLRKLREEEEHE